MLYLADTANKQLLPEPRNAEKVSIKSTFKRILFTKALATAKYATVCIRSVIFLVIK
jgi:hypothetical protein